MPLDRLIDKEPRQFAYFHRLMGYSILSLILVIYTFTSTSASYQLYILPLLLVYFLFCPKLEKWLQYKYDKVIEKNVVFACEAIIVAIVLAGLHLSLVPTFTILFALLYVGLNNKISLPIGCLTTQYCFCECLLKNNSCCRCPPLHRTLVLICNTNHFRLHHCRRRLPSPIRRVRRCLVC